MRARRLTPDDDSVRVDPEFGAAYAQPVEGGEHVVALRGEGGLGREPVVHGRDREPGSDQALERVGAPVTPGGAEHGTGAHPPATAVQEHDHRRLRLLRGVDVQLQRAVARRGGVGDRAAHLPDAGVERGRVGQRVGVRADQSGRGGRRHASIRRCGRNVVSKRCPAAANRSPGGRPSGVAG